LNFYSSIFIVAWFGAGQNLGLAAFYALITDVATQQMSPPIVHGQEAGRCQQREKFDWQETTLIWGEVRK